LFTLLEDNIQQNFPWNNWLIFGEVASGPAAIIPWVGTTVSFAIDGAMTAKDIGEKIKSFNVSKLEPSIT
jgi:hypothetical protein